MYPHVSRYRRAGKHKQSSYLQTSRQTHVVNTIIVRLSVIIIYEDINCHAGNVTLHTWVIPTFPSLFRFLSLLLESPGSELGHLSASLPQRR